MGSYKSRNNRYLAQIVCHQLTSFGEVKLAFAAELCKYTFLATLPLRTTTFHRAAKQFS